MDAMILLAYLLYFVFFVSLSISLVLLLARATFSCRIRGTKTWRWRFYTHLYLSEPGGYTGRGSGLMGSAMVDLGVAYFSFIFNLHSICKAYNKCLKYVRSYDYRRMIHCFVSYRIFIPSDVFSGVFWEVF